MLGMEVWPVWVLVVACGLVGQIFKLVIYSILERRLDLPVLAQSFGLPSLQAGILTCLLMLVVQKSGWSSAETGFALVFTVVVIHDRFKLRLASSRQREAVYRLVVSMPDAGQLHQRVAEYLDPRTHHPIHVVSGVLYGGLFALAFGTGPG